MNIDIALLIFTTVAALWSVLARSLLKATMSLAVTSALISVLIFRLSSPLAAVIELSVCAGLITAVFVSAISLSKPLTHKEVLEISKHRHKRYWYLPFILALAAAALMFLKIKKDFIFALPPASQEEVKTVLWNMRQFDMLGQVVVLLAGALGVVILFSGEKRDGR